MPLDPLSESQVLDWIGAVHDGEDLAVTFGLYATVEATAFSILKRRRATLGPDSWSLSGDYSQNDNGQTARWLDGQIGRLARILGVDISDLPVMLTTPLVREGPRR